MDLMTGEYSTIASLFRVNPESSNNPRHYEDYIRFNALLDYNKGMGVTYIFVEEFEDVKNIMGFVSLRSSSLIKDMGERLKFGYPALEIAELAVDSRYEHQGIGSDMVKFAISQANDLSKTIGIQYVVLCSDPKSVGFYKKLKFDELSSLEEVPREHANLGCTPMYLKIKSY